MELLVACWLVTWLVMEAPQAIADAYVARKAAKAGAWDFLNTEMARRSERDAARAGRRQQWAERIFNRSKAKADGDPKRAGLGTLAGDVYHGVCEDALAKRAARREARPPFDPTRPTVTQKAVDLLKSKVRRQRDDRGDPTPLPDDELVPQQPTDRMPCPRCGQTMTRSPNGWTHPGGVNCQPASPAPHTNDHPDGTAAPNPAPTSPPAVCARCGRVLHGQWKTSVGGSPVCQYGCNAAEQPPPRNCRCRICQPDLSKVNAAADDENRRAVALAKQLDPTGPDEYRIDRTPVDSDALARHFDLAHLSEQSMKENTVTAPTQTGNGAGTAVADVHTNEALRGAFNGMGAAAAKLAEAAALAEQARGEMAAAAQAASDAVSSTAFDHGATAAAHAAADAAGAVSDSTISTWSERAESVRGHAEGGVNSLKKWLDSEDLVATERVDPSTLAPTAS